MSMGTNDDLKYMREQGREVDYKINGYKQLKCDLDF